MNLKRLFARQSRSVKICGLALLLLASITACKARGSNPALNFAPGTGRGAAKFLRGCCQQGVNSGHHHPCGPARAHTTTVSV